MFRRIAESIEMSFDIPDAEKETAAQAKMHFEAAANALKLATEHLDHIYDPFSDHANISTESVIENRGVLQGRYSTRIKNNFNKVKAHGLIAIRKMNEFSTGDNVIKELINTFVDSMGDVEFHVASLLNTLKNDYKSSDFRDMVIKSIEDVRKQAAELDEFIYDIMIEHIDKDFLTKTWMNETSDQLQLDMDEEKIPLVVQLHKEREKQLNPGAFPMSEKQEQTLNMGDAQRMLHPNFMQRDTSMGNFGE